VAVLHDFADASDVKLVDLNARSLELLNEIGQEAAKQVYIDGDKAHFTKQGATQMARLVAQELQRVGSPLGAYVK
jgi:lysophospholipase L1-like esterase